MCDVNLWIILSTLRTWSRSPPPSDTHVCSERIRSERTLRLSRVSLSPAFCVRPFLCALAFARFHFLFLLAQTLEQRKNFQTCKPAIISRDANRNTAASNDIIARRASERANERKRRMKIAVICLQRRSQPTPPFSIHSLLPRALRCASLPEPRRAQLTTTNEIAL